MRVRAHAQSSKRVSYSEIRGRHKPPFFIVDNGVEKARQTCFADVSQSNDQTDQIFFVLNLGHSLSRLTPHPSERLTSVRFAAAS